MEHWWLKLFRRAPAAVPLRSVPTIRRQKNYAAASGYAYEYFYDGMRDTGSAREYEFTVSGDRKNWFHLKVIVFDAAVRAWEAEHGRSLADNERYGIAKMALFDAFDQRENPAAMRSDVQVASELARELGSRLNLS